MRKIKFKAWQKYQERMLEVVGLKYEENELTGICVKYPKGTIPRVIWYSKNDKDFYLYDENGKCTLELIQDTGLKDKYGKEVYDSYIYINHDNGCIGVLSYDGYGLWATEYKDGRMYNNRPFRDLDTTNFEVIGNNFENPKLLK